MPTDALRSILPAAGLRVRMANVTGRGESIHVLSETKAGMVNRCAATAHGR